MTPLEEWDAHWIKVYERAVPRGRTPNEAVVVADKNTEEPLGPRPAERLGDGVSRGVVAANAARRAQQKAALGIQEGGSE